MLVHRLLKKPFFRSYQRPWRWPEEVEEISWKRLRFDNGRGAGLAGAYGPALGDKVKGSLVLVPPLRPDFKGYYLKSGLAQMLREHGYNVLLMDLNGMGESEDSDLLFPLDVVAAGRQLQMEAPGLPMGVLGVSFGATWAMCALSEPGHGFQAAVIESAFTTLEEYWYRLPMAYVVLKGMNVLLRGTMSRLRPIDRMRALQDVQEVLLIYAGHDELSPVSMGERLLAACPLPEERRSLWIIPEAEHSRVWQMASEAYRERVLGVFDRCLAPSAP